jgi:phytoene synthase
MVHRRFHTIFKKGSRTFFYSSLEFPERIKEDVFILYSFVRKADNFVDTIPQQKEAFCSFKSEYEKAVEGKRTKDPVIGAFVDLMRRKRFKRTWIKAFLYSMELDIIKQRYATIRETEEYMYGSAEVVGILMAQIMGLDARSHTCARNLGKAMQYINFIRDIREDLQLGRMYLPMSMMRKYDLISLHYDYVIHHRTKYNAFIRGELNRFKSWQKKAECGYRYIPPEYLVSIKTASEMYLWTAQQIAKDPLVVYRRKIIPPKRLIRIQLARNKRQLL